MGQSISSSLTPEQARLLDLIVRGIPLDSIYIAFELGCDESEVCVEFDLFCKKVGLMVSVGEMN